MDSSSSQARMRMDARLTLDTYYANLLRCKPELLRAPDWETVTVPAVDSAAARAIGMRQEVFLLAPLPSQASGSAGGVALLAPGIAARAGNLFDIQPGVFFQPAPLRRLDRLVRESVTRPLAPGCEPRLTLWSFTLADPLPPVGRWADWIEPLDPETENDSFGRALLARGAGGVFVARVRDAIVAYCGLRALSAKVWELTPPELTASAQGYYVAQPESLLRALLARATRAARAAEAIPICFTSSRALPLRRRLMACGYHPYARASAYASLTG